MRRGLRNAAVTATALWFLYALVLLYDAALRDPRFFDGWVLFAAMVAQVLFHIRKKLPSLPLGPAAAWLQGHIYIGYFTVAAFAVHTGFGLPDSGFEWALWSLFVLVTASGIAGAYLSWSIPTKLEQNAEESLFDEMPAARSVLARDAHDLAIGSVSQAGSLAISDLYATTLHPFFRSPQNLMAHLRSSRRPLQRLCDQIDSLERYLDSQGKETMTAMKKLVVAKDDLDFQYAHLRALQTWMFVHVPATYALIVLTIVHVAVVYAYSAGVP